MTTEELIPVLKALHADPRCAPVMADWFEERGDDKLAGWLRKAPESVFHGDTLISIVRKMPCESREPIRVAVAREAFDRLHSFTRIGEDLSLVYVRNEMRNLVEMRTGRRPPEWVVVNIVGTSAELYKLDYSFYTRPQQHLPSFTMIRPDGTEQPPLPPIPHVTTMGYRPFAVNVHQITKLDGERLILNTDFWFGLSTDDRVYVSQIEPHHVTPA